MQFSKMHGIGNDYVYLDVTDGREPENLPRLARLVSDRHFGVGSDGLILIGPSDRGDFRMRMFNADGSESEMCGNGIRCVGKYVYDHGLTDRTDLTIQTGDGIKKLRLFTEGDRVDRVQVDMGPPTLNGPDIPTTLPGNPVVDEPLEVAGRRLSVTCVSMGNPHAITYVEAVDDYPVREVGPLVETDGHFPNRVNAEFVEIVDPVHVRVRVWERGTGETLACGTGACAVAVAGVLTERTDRRLTVTLPGGDLELEWASDRHVYMTGPAVEVFTGQWNPPGA